MQIKFFVWLLQRTLLTGRIDVLFRAGEEGSQVPRWRSGGGRAVAVTMEEWGCRASCWHVDGRQLEHCTRQGNRPCSKRASEGSGNNCSCRALFWTVRSRSHGGEYETTWPNEWRQLMELISLCRDKTLAKLMDGVPRLERVRWTVSQSVAEPTKKIKRAGRPRNHAVMATTTVRAQLLLKQLRLQFFDEVKTEAI